MVGMTAFPVGKDQYSGTLFPKDANDLQAIVPGVFDSTVGYVERLPPGNLQNTCRFGRFGGSIFCRAACSHFSLREIENSRAISALRHLEQGSSAGLFDVVAVSGQGENV